MPQKRIDRITKAKVEKYVFLLDEIAARWTSPGHKEVIDMHIAYGDFTNEWQGHPLSEWPDSFEGHVYKVYILYDGDLFYNKNMLVRHKRHKVGMWMDCWYSSNRKGRHEFRVPLNPTDDQWREYYGRES
jgi:hypothetical protein